MDKKRGESRMEREQERKANEASAYHARILNYIQDPTKWLYDVCPLKRHKEGREPELGYLMKFGGPRVYAGNMFMAKPDTPYTEYAGFEELLDDGWRVD